MAAEWDRTIGICGHEWGMFAPFFSTSGSVCLSLQIYHTSDYLGTSMVVFKYYHACYLMARM